MKSLLWKELRQLAPWSAAMLVAMSAIMIGSLIAEADRFYYSLYQQAWFQVFRLFPNSFTRTFTKGGFELWRIGP